MSAPDHAGDDAPVHGEEAQGSERPHTVNVPQEMLQLARDQLRVHGSAKAPQNRIVMPKRNSMADVTYPMGMWKI